jgi:hypothetical protein
MLRKTFLAMSASAVLGAAVIASGAALAFPLGPPPMPGRGGPPPMPGLGGPPPGLGAPRLGPGGSPHLGAGGPPRLGLGGARAPAAGLAARSGAAGRAGSNYAYSRSGSHGRYDHGRGRYGVYAYGDSGSSSDDCYYTYSRGRRVLVCD